MDCQHHRAAVISAASLHSFPTRRSSDLMLAPSTTKESIGVKIQGLNWFIRGWCEYYRSTSSPARTFKNITQELLDRKSTRLNSSHMSISYAVFCLKKKPATSGRRPGSGK